MKWTVADIDAALEVARARRAKCERESPEWIDHTLRIDQMLDLRTRAVRCGGSIGK